MWGKRKRLHLEPPEGFHDGTAFNINVVKSKSGYDVVDTFSNEIIAEFDDDEIKELFLFVNKLMTNTMNETLQALSRALPEAERKGELIAQINFGTFTMLHQTAKLSQVAAFRQGWSATPKGYIPE